MAGLFWFRQPSTVLLTPFRDDSHAGTSRYGDSCGVQSRMSVAGSSAAARHSAELVRIYSWSERTESSRQSQWRAWLASCEQDELTPLPVTEGHKLAFIGWLKSSHEQGTKMFSASSIPQYLSAVRVMHQLFTGESVPHYPMVDIFRRTYAK